MGEIIVVKNFDSSITICISIEKIVPPPQRANEQPVLAHTTKIKAIKMYGVCAESALGRYLKKNKGHASEDNIF